MKYSKYNVIIIGSGISGLHLANKLSECSSFKEGILVVTKNKLFSGSSALAQGGIVSVIPEINPSDSIESHIKDTMISGCGLNNLNTVRYVSEQSASAIDDLMRFGVNFDKSGGRLNFTLEGAHSCPRILHIEGDSTGRKIEEVLCDNLRKKDNVELYKNTMAVELLVDNKNACRGIVAYNHELNNYEAIYSNCVVIATGGIGQIYKNTTNPIESTGDGIALAISAGAKLENMEFVQFHPTALYCKSKSTIPLVSESVRGEGAKLVNLRGDYFAKNYDERADLAPRDIVARAIISEISSNNENHVNLDISQIGIEKFKKRFPTITSLCEENDVDLSTGFIPVIPAEHYFMGGIKTDINSKTSIENLYAIGECASTGLHGANRLASNSLLECVVFANSLTDYLSSNFKFPPKRHDEKIQKILEKYTDISASDENYEILEEKFNLLKTTMTDNVGIVRTSKTLTDAINSILMIKADVSKLNCCSKLGYELSNAILVGYEIASAALIRENSIGAHYRSDYTNKPNVEDNLKERTLNNDKIFA